MQYKKLEDVIIKKDFINKKIAEGEYYFIYSKANLAEPDKIMAFQVFERKISGPRKIADAETQAAEAWPENESFGCWSWEFPDLARAVAWGTRILPHRATQEPVSPLGKPKYHHRPKVPQISQGTA